MLLTITAIATQIGWAYYIDHCVLVSVWPNVLWASFPFLALMWLSFTIESTTCVWNTASVVSLDTDSLQLPTHCPALCSSCMSFYLSRPSSSPIFSKHQSERSESEGCLQPFLHPLLLTEHTKAQRSAFNLIWSNWNHQVPSNLI